MRIFIRKVQIFSEARRNVFHAHFIKHLIYFILRSGYDAEFTIHAHQSGGWGRADVHPTPTMANFVGLCHFCEYHGPTVVMLTQTSRKEAPPKQTAGGGGGSQLLVCDESVPEPYPAQGNGF